MIGSVGRLAMAAAVQSLRIGGTSAGLAMDATEHAALTVVCVTVLNLDEALNK